MNWLKRRIENQSIGLVPILLFMALDNIFAYQLSFFVAIAFCVLSLGIYYSLRRERVRLRAYRSRKVDSRASRMSLAFSRHVQEKRNTASRSQFL